MNEFALRIISNPKNEDDVLCCYGEIVMGKGYDQFIMTLDSWTIEDYKRQWGEAIERLRSHDVSCFVTRAQNLEDDPFIWTWPLYKIGDTVYIQNRLLCDLEASASKQSLYKDFNTQNCYNFIKPRETIDEDGNKISEWSVPLADVLSFKVV